MSLIAIILLALAMSADAFAVAVSHGARMPRMVWPEALRIALVFGVFQGVMPLLGWLAGHTAADFANAWGKWIAFVMLAGIAVKMLWESRTADDGEDKLGGRDGIISHGELLIAGIATSIDALAAGVGLAFVNTSIVAAASVIAVCTFVMSIIGVWIGRQIGVVVGKWAEIIGALILLALAVSFVLR